MKIVNNQYKWLYNSIRWICKLLLYYNNNKKYIYIFPIVHACLFYLIFCDINQKLLAARGSYWISSRLVSKVHNFLNIVLSINLQWHVILFSVLIYHFALIFDFLRHFFLFVLKTLFIFPNIKKNGNFQFCFLIKTQWKRKDVIWVKF